MSPMGQVEPWPITDIDNLRMGPERLAIEAGVRLEDIERGKSVPISAGLPPYSLLNLLRQSAVKEALPQSRRPGSRG